MLDRNRPVQTRDGRSVTIYTWDAPGKRPIHGRIEGDTFPTSWDAKGSGDIYSLNNHDFDLVNVPKPKIKVERYIYVFKDGSTTTVRTPGTCNYYKPVACKHLVFEIEEGQFDD